MSELTTQTLAEAEVIGETMEHIHSLKHLTYNLMAMQDELSQVIKTIAEKYDVSADMLHDAVIKYHGLQDG